MSYYMIEKLGILLTADETNIHAEYCTIETIEMDYVRINQNYFKRGIFIDESVQVLHSVDDTIFDDFDLQEQCEEYYNA